MPSERDLAVFLVGLATLLGVARVLGEIARHLRLPAVAGELAAGVLLGPSVLGRLAPGSVKMLFPPGPPATMLNAYTLLASVLLLTLAGLEIDLSVIMRRRREAALTSLAGVALPMALGVALGWVLPPRYLVDPSHRWLFALFVGTALSISAMPVIAKTLLDLGFFRTNLGLLIMAAAMVDDLLGWLLFSLLVGPMLGRHSDATSIALRVAAVATLFAVVLTLGRRLFDRLLGVLERDRISAPGRVLSLLIVTAVLGAALTQALGIHAVFGAFLVGTAIGQSPRLSAETRSHVHEFVSNVFAPVFFAAVGLRVDFVAAFDAGLVVPVLLVACVAKVVGCALGARTGGLPWRQALGVGVAMNSRGAMEIILALVALQAGLIHPPFFVALVIMALVTSLIAGPLLERLLRSRTPSDVAALLEEGAVVLALRARTPDQAVRELAQELTASTPLDGGALADLALDDGAAARAGLTDGIAVAFAQVPGIARPMLALGRSPAGLDFNARDGHPARLIFLFFVPRDQAAKLIDLHMSVVYAVATAEQRTRVLTAESRAEVLEALRTGLEAGRRTTLMPRPARVPT